MSNISLKGVSIEAVAASVPANIRKNSNYNELKEEERGLLIRSTGIREMRVATSTTTASDLCFIAAKEILENLDVDIDEIGLLVFVSQTNDYFLPATSALLQDRLGLSKSTMCFDVGLGCSGYVYGLSIVASLLKNNSKTYALLLAGDVSTATCTSKDRSTYPIFGDAGSATLLRKGDDNLFLSANFFTDGSDFDAIIVPDGMLRNKVSRKTLELSENEYPYKLILKGEKIFSFSTREVPKSINALANSENIDLQEVDYFFMHQANKLINETIRKKLQIDYEKYPYSLGEFGNTSSASIPLTMVTQLNKEILCSKLLLLSGFGVGLSWANMLVGNSNIKILPLIEVQ